MRLGPFQAKSGVKAQSTRLKRGGHHQLDLALRIWELKQDFPNIITGWRDQISAQHKVHQQIQQRSKS